MLDGPTSYHVWSQNMTVFLKGRKLWRYVIGSIPKPVPNPKSKATTIEESSKTTIRTDDYEERLEESRVFRVRSCLGLSIPLFPPFIIFFLVLKLLRLLGNFWLIAIFALMIQAWSSTLNQNSIKCAKRQVSLFLIFILRLLLCGNNSLLQILHWCVLRTLSTLSNIEIAVTL